MNILKIIALILCIIGSVNWGLIGLLNFNLVDTLFSVGSLISIIIYILVGVSGFISILTLIDLIEKKIGLSLFFCYINSNFFCF